MSQSSASTITPPRQCKRPRDEDYEKEDPFESPLKQPIQLRTVFNFDGYEYTLTVKTASSTAETQLPRLLKQAIVQKFTDFNYIHPGRGPKKQIAIQKFNDWLDIEVGFGDDIHCAQSIKDTRKAVMTFCKNAAIKLEQKLAFTRSPGGIFSKNFRAIGGRERTQMTIRWNSWAAGLFWSGEKWGIGYPTYTYEEMDGALDHSVTTHRFTPPQLKLFKRKVNAEIAELEKEVGFSSSVSCLSVFGCAISCPMKV